MSERIDARTVGLVLLVGIVVVMAGCTGGSGTKTYTGNNSQAARAGNLSLHSAKVTNGVLRQLTITNNGSTASPNGTWQVQLTGTSNKKAATYNTTMNVSSIPADGTKSVTIQKGNQPDWQDGANLTIRATPPGGTQGITLTIKPQ